MSEYRRAMRTCRRCTRDKLIEINRTDICMDCENELNQYHSPYGEEQKRRHEPHVQRNPENMNEKIRNNGSGRGRKLRRSRQSEGNRGQPNNYDSNAYPHVGTNQSSSYRPSRGRNNTRSQRPINNFQGMFEDSPMPVYMSPDDEFGFHEEFPNFGFPNFSHGFDPFSGFQSSNPLDHFDSLMRQINFNHVQSRPRRSQNLVNLLFGEFRRIPAFDFAPMESFLENTETARLNITELLSNLATMHPQGQHPANPTSIRNLVTIAVTSEIITHNPTCTVCQEDLKLREIVKKLKCQHCFHEDCIMPWLNVQNTCPMCRKPI